MGFENIRLYPITLFFIKKFQCNYDLNLCRYLNPELPPMRGFASLYFLIRHPFVCGILFPGINLNYPYSWKQSSTYKSAILADTQRSKVSEFAILQWYSTSCISTYFTGQRSPNNKKYLSTSPAIRRKRSVCPMAGFKMHNRTSVILNF